MSNKRMTVCANSPEDSQAPTQLSAELASTSLEAGSPRMSPTFSAGLAVSKTVLALVCICSIFVICLSLTGCSGGGSSADVLIGTWEVVPETSTGGAAGNVNTSTLGDFVFVFDGDGTFETKIKDSSGIKGEWKADGSSITVIYNGMEFAGNIEGDSMELSAKSGSYSMKLQKMGS